MSTPEEEPPAESRKARQGRKPRGAAAANTWGLRTSPAERAYIARALPGKKWSAAAARDLALGAPAARPDNLPDDEHFETGNRYCSSVRINALEEGILQGRRRADEGKTTTLRRLALWAAAERLA